MWVQSAGALYIFRVTVNNSLHVYISLYEIYIIKPYFLKVAPPPSTHTQSNGTVCGWKFLNERHSFAQSYPL